MHPSISAHSFLSSSLRRKRSESEFEGGSRGSSVVISGRRVSYTSLIESSEYPYSNHHVPNHHRRHGSTTASSESDHDDSREKERQLVIAASIVATTSSSTTRNQLRSSRSRTRAASISAAYGNPCSNNGMDIANGNIRNFPSSYSDYQLFTGRKPRPLSLPPSVPPLLGGCGSLGGSTTSLYQQRENPFVTASPIGNRSYSSATRTSGGSGNTRKIPDGHITSSSKLPSSYTQKFPVSYFTPEPVTSSHHQRLHKNGTKMSSGNSNDSNGGIRSATGNNSAATSSLLYSSEHDVSSSSGTIGPSTSLYQSSKCLSYSFHGHPVNGNELSSNSPSGGSRSISDDASPGSGSLKIPNCSSHSGNSTGNNTNNNGNSNRIPEPGGDDDEEEDDRLIEELSDKTKSNGDINNTSQYNLDGGSSSKESTCSSAGTASVTTTTTKLACNSSCINSGKTNRRSAMSSSKSFTHASFYTGDSSMSNTLPRAGKHNVIHKSSEQLALFLDILSSQEKFVKVGSSTVIL